MALLHPWLPVFAFPSETVPGLAVAPAGTVCRPSKFQRPLRLSASVSFKK